MKHLAHINVRGVFVGLPPFAANEAEGRLGRDDALSGHRVSSLPNDIGAHVQRLVCGLMNKSPAARLRLLGRRGWHLARHATPTC